MRACVARVTGLVGYKIDRCRCKDCTKASSDYQRTRTRMTAYGRWQPFVDAEPVRQHINQLRAAHIGTARIAELAGVAQRVVSSLIWQPEGKAPRTKVRPETAQAILAVTASLESAADKGLVSTTGSRRRVHALAALGWSIHYVAGRIGRQSSNLATTLQRTHMQADAARKIAEIYEELSTRRPEDTPSNRRVRTIARKSGWAPPAAWDDETIDDPDAEPNLGDPDADVVDEVLIERALHGERTQLSPANRLHAVATGRRRGMPLTAIGIQLRMSHDTVRALDRQLSAA
jgi:hypothetical protein